VEVIDVIKGKKGGFQLKTLERTYLLQADSDDVRFFHFYFFI
jgi:hypothetical protein